MTSTIEDLPRHCIARSSAAASSRRVVPRLPTPPSHGAMEINGQVAWILAPLNPWMLRRTYGTGWLSDLRPSEVNEPSAGCDLERGGVQAGSILGGLFRDTSPMNTPKPLGLWTPSLRQVAKKCRLRRSAARKTAWDVWEVNAGWVAWLDGTAVLMTRMTGILLDIGARRPDTCNGSTLCFAW
jgi:hypothetical protein